MQNGWILDYTMDALRSPNMLESGASRKRAAAALKAVGGGRMGGAALRQLCFGGSRCCLVHLCGPLSAGRSCRPAGCGTREAGRLGAVEWRRTSPTRAPLSLD